MNETEIVEVLKLIKLKVGGIKESFLIRRLNRAEHIKPSLIPTDLFWTIYTVIKLIRKGALCCLSFKSTVGLKICGYFHRVRLEPWELDPEPLTVPSNQVDLKSDSVLRDGGVAFGPSALLRAEFD